MDVTKKKGFLQTTRTGKIDDFGGIIYKIDESKF